jgi:hypothetical protein
MKQTPVVMILMLWVALAPAWNAPDEVRDRVPGDPRMVAPGLGAEGVLLGATEGDVVRKYGDRDLSVARAEAADLFSQVLKVRVDCSVIFDRILRFGDSDVSFFIYQGSVVAITGAAPGRRVLSEGVEADMGRGADYVVFSLGNQGLERISSGKNRLYLYAGRGFLVADDQGNDSIDLYAVFRCLRGAAPGTR